MRKTRDRAKKLHWAARCRCVHRPLLLRARAARSKSAGKTSDHCDATGQTQCPPPRNEREVGGGGGGRGRGEGRGEADSTPWNRIYRARDVCRPPPRRVLRADAINLHGHAMYTHRGVSGG